MKFKKLLFKTIFCGFIVAGIPTIAQNIEYPKKVVSQLASKKMYGRGYVKNGDQQAAIYIQTQLEKMGIMPVNGNYFQPFHFPVNTFPGKMNVRLGHKPLKPMADYAVSPNSKGISGTFSIIYLPAAADTVDYLFDSLLTVDYGNKFLVAPFTKRKITHDNRFKARGVIVPTKQLYWWASTAGNENNVILLLVNDSLLREKPTEISINIESQFVEHYTSNNVMGFIEGNEQPDSIIIFCAHYDHLGCMGKKNVFYGANDNASGTAMVLWLAQHFSQPANTPKYSILFLLFAAEERGLLGSTHFVENPPIALNSVNAVINLDMVGTGSKGISIVNGALEPRISETLVAINRQKSYLPDIVIGGESCNSDHCPFHKAGVPAVFIFTRGPEFKAYHNLRDVSQKLPYTKFSELQQLLIQFTEVF